MQRMLTESPGARTRRGEARREGEARRGAEGGREEPEEPGKESASQEDAEKVHGRWRERMGSCGRRVGGVSRRTRERKHMDGIGIRELERPGGGPGKISGRVTIGASQWMPATA